MSNQGQKVLDEAAHSIKLPKKVYKVRVIDCNLGTSANQNPMLTGQVEIFDCEKINGVDINGLNLSFRSVLTPKALKFVNITRSALGLPEVTLETLANISPEEYVKCEGYAICAGKTEDKVDEVTGEPMTDPYTGEKLVSNRRELVEWIARPKK